MKYRVWVAGLILMIGIGVWWGITNPKFSNSEIFSPGGETKKELPYERYSLDRLAERGGVASKIEIGRKLTDYQNYSSYVFYYQSEGRKISGQLNLPNLSRLMGVVVMARGYVEKEGYKTGLGTKNAAGVYAEHGYITLAPDFSGYGESDPEDLNALGARLVKPVEILDLIASLPSLPSADLSRAYLWGHSNGGQIMLSVAEILGMRNQELGIRGVTLWAPVSKPFPYNVLFYTDDASDSGKWLRSEIAKFETDYDVFNYSIDRYLEWINIPVQVHQGSLDDAVPKKWSDDLVKNLKDKEKDVTYYTYLGADHNMRPNWDSVVARDMEWFNQLVEESE